MKPHETIHKSKTPLGEDHRLGQSTWPENFATRISTALERNITHGSCSCTYASARLPSFPSRHWPSVQLAGPWLAKRHKYVYLSERVHCNGTLVSCNYFLRTRQCQLLLNNRRTQDWILWIAAIFEVNRLSEEVVLVCRKKENAQNSIKSHFKISWKTRNQLNFSFLVHGLHSLLLCIHFL